MERTPPCDLIPAQAVGQEGSCNTHFPCTRPGSREILHRQRSGSQSSRSCTEWAISGGPSAWGSPGSSQGHLGLRSPRLRGAVLRLLSSSRPRGWSQEGTPSSLVSREAEQEEAMSRECTLRLGGQHLPRRRTLTHKTPQGSAGHLGPLQLPAGGALIPLPAPASSLPRALGKGAETRLAEGQNAWVPCPSLSFSRESRPLSPLGK